MLMLQTHKLAKRQSMATHVNEKDKLPTCVGCKADWPCDGQRMAKWFDDFFNGVVAVGTLGGGFTFTVIFSSLDTRNGLLTPEEVEPVRHLITIAWLLFVLAVGIASVSGAIARFNAQGIIDEFNQKGGPLPGWVIWASATSLILQLLVIAAFLVSATAVMQYDESTGIAALAIISVVAVLLVVLWILKAL